MINDQYTVPDTVAVERTFVLVSFSTRKHTSMVARAILSNFCEEQLNQNSPQYVSEFSRALCPTTFLELAVYKFIKLSGYRIFYLRLYERQIQRY